MISAIMLIVALTLVLIIYFQSLHENNGPKTLYSGKYLSLKTFKNWDYVERNGIDKVAYIVPLFIDESGNKSLIFIKEFRIPLQKYVISFPAGLIGDKDCGESIWVGAKRELLEETGYTGILLPIARGPTSSGLSNEVLDFFLAIDLNKQGEALGDGTEKIDVHVVPICEAYEWLEKQSHLDGYFVDPKVYLGLYFVCKYLNEVI